MKDGLEPSQTYDEINKTSFKSKILVRIANWTMIRLLHQKQTDLDLHCLSLPFWKAAYVQNLRTLTICCLVLKTTVCDGYFGYQNRFNVLKLKNEKKNHNFKLKFCLPVSGPSINPSSTNRNKSCLLFSSAKYLRSLYGKSVGPDQTALIGAVCSGSTLFALYLICQECWAINCSRQLQQTSFFRFIFSWRFKG